MLVTLQICNGLFSIRQSPSHLAVKTVAVVLGKTAGLSALCRRDCP
jgi:hypothetical protein